MNLSHSTKMCGLRAASAAGLCIVVILCHASIYIPAATLCAVGDSHWLSATAIARSGKTRIAGFEFSCAVKSRHARNALVLKLRGGGGVMPSGRSLSQEHNVTQSQDQDASHIGLYPDKIVGEEAREGTFGGGFPTLTARDGEALEVQSLCMNCEEQGTTSILPTTIPRFGQVVIMAFQCPACNYSSNNVQDAAEIKPFGVHYILSAATRQDLDRQVLKSQHATIRLPDLDFEIPPATQAGSLTTVEGILTHAASALETLQVKERR